jgi:hypothetical protein
MLQEYRDKKVSLLDPDQIGLTNLISSTDQGGGKRRAGKQNCYLIEIKVPTGSDILLLSPSVTPEWEVRMRLVLFTFSIIVATTVLNTPTKAQNYPWCAIYSGGGAAGGGTNCGFLTSQQCMETARGLGSFCYRNTQYVPPPGPHPYPGQRRYPY